MSEADDMTDDEDDLNVKTELKSEDEPRAQEDKDKEVFFGEDGDDDEVWSTNTTNNYLYFIKI